VYDLLSLKAQHDRWSSLSLLGQQFSAGRGILSKPQQLPFAAECQCFCRIMHNTNTIQSTLITKRTLISGQLTTKNVKCHCRVVVILTMLWLVAVSSRPPNVMIGVRHAKYMKKNEARHCGCKASLKSLKYHGALRSTSLHNPPNNLQNKTKFTPLYNTIHQTNVKLDFNHRSKFVL